MRSAELRSRDSPHRGRIIFPSQGIERSLDTEVCKSGPLKIARIYISLGARRSVSDEEVRGSRGLIDEISGFSSQLQAGGKDLPPETGQGFRDYVDFNVKAEELGFHSSFLVDHHFTGWNQVAATLMLLTSLAMRTTTLRLGSGVITLPWHNPVLQAEEAATLT